MRTMGTRGKLIAPSPYFTRFTHKMAEIVSHFYCLRNTISGLISTSKMRKVIRSTSIALIMATFIAVQPINTDARSHVRSAKQRCDFLRAAGYRHCRPPPGYVVDHIVPLCAGGADAPSNMQLQTKRAALRKDVGERAQCRALKRR